MRYIEIAKTIKELARNIPQLLSLEGGHKMPSLKDLAKECGVSVATVSKALNNQPDIAPATRDGCGPQRTVWATCPMLPPVP